MKKTEITINADNFPEELRYIFQNTKVYDSSSHPLNTVLYSELGYYVKIAERGTLSSEVKMAKLFEQNSLGVEVVSYLSADRDYFVTKPAQGEDATHYLDAPETLCEVLAGTMKFLHRLPIEDVPVSPCMETYDKAQKLGFLRQDTFIHGDFCLPNVILNDGKFNCFIDLGLAGVGDRHIDIYWALWSLNFNLKTDKYTGYFLELYGKDSFDRDVLKLVSEVETQA